MAISKQQKENLLESYKASIALAPNAFLIDALGITVPQVTELRDKVRATGGKYVVVKNRIALRAIEGAALDGLRDKFVGPTAVAYGDDPVSIAKVLTEFTSTVPTLQFKGGLVDGQPISAEQVSAIATMPSRDELLAKLLYLLQSPITRFVRTLAAVPRDFVVVLDQIRHKKEATSA
jgi:large subunit ribosomal protein L10